MIWQSPIGAFDAIIVDFDVEVDVGSERFFAAHPASYSAAVLHLQLLGRRLNVVIPVDHPSEPARSEHDHDGSLLILQSCCACITAI